MTPRAKQSGVITRQYAYNGRGEQVRRHLGSASTYTLYDEAGRWLGDYNDSGVPIQQAIWMDDMPVGVLANGQMYYVQPDHLGTPRAVINPVRDVAVWKWDLKGEAFGSTPPEQDPDGDGLPFVFDMRFPGQRFDVVSGLNYNYFRDYDAGSGRYVESDPIGLFGDIATYSYAANNSLSYTDPDGKQPIQDCRGGLGVVVCDGNGGFKSLNCNRGCTSKCTQLHENQHVIDLLRMAPNRCRGKRAGDTPAIREDLATGFYYQLECAAHRVGKKCAEKMLGDQNMCLGPECKDDAQRYLDKANYFIGYYRCDAYGW